MVNLSAEQRRFVMERRRLVRHWPKAAWFNGALALIAILTIQGFGYLMPTQLRVCFELQKLKLDHEGIARLMSKFFYVVASQGVVQVAIIIVMAKFVSGI